MTQVTIYYLFDSARFDDNQQDWLRNYVLLLDVHLVQGSYPLWRHNTKHLSIDMEHKEDTTMVRVGFASDLDDAAADWSQLWQSLGKQHGLTLAAAESIQLMGTTVVYSEYWGQEEADRSWLTLIPESEGVAQNRSLVLACGRLWHLTQSETLPLQQYYALISPQTASRELIGSQLIYRPEFWLAEMARCRIERLWQTRAQEDEKGVLYWLDRYLAWMRPLAYQREMYDLLSEMESTWQRRSRILEQHVTD